MSAARKLADYLHHAAATWPYRMAVEETDGSSMTYEHLAQLSDRVAQRLQGMGVQRGDRVGIWLRKSIDAVAAIFGILKAGAAYVPVDPSAPATRNGYIFANCQARAIFVEDRYARGLAEELRALGSASELVHLEGVGAGAAMRRAINDSHPLIAAEQRPIVSAPDDLAYILYTSGSTGKPKGVMLSHENATSFVDWCSETFSPTEEDRFSAHAPFHFDLSILDIFVSIKHGATLVIIGEELGKEPLGLAQFISTARITHWYSAPSILSLLAQRGRLSELDYGQLRTVLFAGEVFPIVHLNALRRLWPHPVYYNLYGPTETNVCTYYQLPPRIETERAEPYPIGRVCEHLAGIVVDEAGREVDKGGSGELCIAGPSVLRGYWGAPELTDRAFLVDSSGRRWYRTGDIVSADEHGNYKYLGRRDRMVKKRGYRVELGEIEACLYRHAEIAEAAVVAIPHDVHGLLVNAHLVIRGGERLSLIRLKQFCSEHLPGYMVPDQFTFHRELPKTSTGKVDYQTLTKASSS